MKQLYNQNKKAKNMKFLARALGTSLFLARAIVGTSLYVSLRQLVS